MTSPDVCIYCLAPGCLTGDVEHATTCPQVTHVYPYTEEDASIRGGFICIACEDPFSVGDSYVEIDADPTHPAIAGAIDKAEELGAHNADIKFLLCVGCAALGRTA